MLENLIPMVVMTGMFAMIFGIVYIRSRENMALIEKGLNPRTRDVRPRPFINLKWGLLLIGSGMGLLLAYIIDNTILKHNNTTTHNATITEGGHHSPNKKHVVVVTDTSHSVKDTVLAVKSAVTNNTPEDDDDTDEHSITEIRGVDNESAAIYFALIAIGGGLGLFFSYRIEKKEWLDKKMDA